MLSWVNRLRRINHGVAVAAGLVLLACVAVTLIDIVARRFGASFGGTDELSGYVMAITTSWGMSYALTEMAHVRIDLVRIKLAPLARSLFDAVALLSLAATAIVVAIKTWPVLAKTLQTGARANTPMETPLWIPQSLWWAGCLWFALSAALLGLAVLALIARRDYASVDAIGGVQADETGEPA